ncbi:MAG: 2-hydroxyacyl-CoA dehydratase family protein [Thermodesulfobacteriota bacterium]|nr:2-hydroxyacyl-CoA dehydratase family protein [Thermodesulfobacteriota bacterium]
MNGKKPLETLKPIERINQQVPDIDEIKEWKARGGRVVGWLCDYVPEELIHAAGLLPVRVTGVSKEISLDDANAYLYTTTCSFVRTCFQLAFGKKYDFLDGFVVASNCDHARRLFDVWDRYIPTPYRYILSVPHTKLPQAQKFYERELEDFKKSLEAHFEVRIPEANVGESIKLFNQTRRSLRKLNELRKEDSPKIMGAEVSMIMNACEKLPKEKFNPMIESILQELKNTRRENNTKLRLMVSGSVLNNANYVEFIEDQGCSVVIDDLCTGVRYWWDEVSEDRAPMEALAHRYLTRFPCARMTPGEDRFNQVVTLAKEYRVDGVIQEMVRYCTPTAWERPWLRKGFEDENIPVLQLEILYGATGTGQLKVRIQAFLEMLEMQSEEFL